MKRLLAVFVMMALPAAAQNRPASGAGGGQASGGGGPHASSGPSGGGSGGTAAPSGASSGSSGSGSASGGSVSGGGSTSSGGGAHSDAGARHAASGGSGVAVSRGGERGGYTAPGRHGDNGAISSGNPSSASGAGAGDARAAARNDGSPRNARTGDGLVPSGTSFGRPRGNEPVVGTAVPRGSVPPASRPGGGTIVTGGAGYYYPWWWLGGGAAFYSNCWMYSSFCSNSFGSFGGYAAPYYGYYDPWFGGYPDMDQAAGGGGGGAEAFVPVDEGSLRLKIKPKSAEVYVDGFYVGVVDDFDGMFQKLHIESGPHRVEVRAEGYEPLVIEVRITAEHATTYQGELKRIK